MLDFLYDDVEKLNGVPKKPDKKTAAVLIGYLNLKDEKAIDIIETLCADELKRYFEWVDEYCLKNNCPREMALMRIIKE